MRRLIRTILLVAVFLAGYYVGHLPGSPDIANHAAKACRRIDAATRQIAAKAEDEHTSLPRAALSCLFGQSPQGAQPEDPQALPPPGR